MTKSGPPKSRTIRAYSWGNPLDKTIKRSRKINASGEKEIKLQKFIEGNLTVLFGLELVKSEFSLKGTSSRLDTLAFDIKKKCFVAIEYKKEDTDRIYKQLVKYAGSGLNAEDIMELSNEYSRFSSNNPGLDLPPVHDIVFDKNYCIYISYHISDEFVKEQASLRRGNDIRMYEMHFFDGAVVLCRADHDEHSKDDGLDDETAATQVHVQRAQTPPQQQNPQTQDDMKSIVSLDRNTPDQCKPVSLTLPDGETVPLDRWRDALRKIGHWLFANNHIADASKGSPLLSEIRLQPDGKPYPNEKISSNLYLSLIGGNVEILANTKKLLKNVNYRPGDFRVQLAPKSSAGPTQQTSQPPPEPIPPQSGIFTDARSILDVNPDATKKHNPDTLVFPDGTSVGELRGWATAYRSVVEWLYRQGKIKNASQSSLLQTERSRSCYELHDRLYINMHGDARTILTRTKKILSDIGYEKGGFKVTLKPKD